METNLPLLKAAIYLIKSGYKKEARPLLFNLLDRNPADEVAFLWYADTIPDLRDRIYTLEDFLQEYPESAYVQTGLSNIQEEYRLYRSGGRDGLPPAGGEEPSTGKPAAEIGGLPQAGEEKVAEETQGSSEAIAAGEGVEGAPTGEEIIRGPEPETIAESAVEHGIAEEIPSEMIPEKELADAEGKEGQVLEEEPSGEPDIPFIEREGGRFPPETIGEIEQAQPEEGGETSIPMMQPEEASTGNEVEEDKTAGVGTTEEEDYTPDWLKEADLVERAVESVEPTPEGAPPEESETNLDRTGIDWLDEMNKETTAKPGEVESQEYPIPAGEPTTGMTSASYSAPTKQPRQASADDIVQRIRKAEELPPQPAAPLYEVETREKPKSNKKTLRMLEVMAILLVCCIGLFIIAYFAQPLLLESADAKYAREMAPILESINNWMSGPITSWNQVLDEQVYNDQAMTYRELLAEQMASGTGNSVVKERLLPTAKEIVDQGVVILDQIDTVAEPVEVADAHQDVTECVLYEIEYMANVVNFLQYNKSSEIGQSRCGNFTSAYDEVRRFVDTNR